MQGLLVVVGRAEQRKEMILSVESPGCFSELCGKEGIEREAVERNLGVQGSRSRVGDIGY